MDEPRITTITNLQVESAPYQTLVRRDSFGARINGEESGASGKRKYEEFFVGTAQQFKDQVPNQSLLLEHPKRLQPVCDLYTVTLPSDLSSDRFPDHVDLQCAAPLSLL